MLVGSSPRVWGQVSTLKFPTFAKGIIPTRVGTRACALPFLQRRTDHPHACGDKQKKKTGQRKSQGSSPRVWGQEPCNRCPHLRVGIIPTRVGTRKNEWDKEPDIEDHPHACGDKGKEENRHRRFRGSSPRVWGQEKLYLLFLL